jgi:hypothetical protein
MSRSPLPLSGRHLHGSGQKMDGATSPSARSGTQQNGRQGVMPKRLAGEWTAFAAGFCSRVPAVRTRSTTARDDRTTGQAKERHAWRSQAAELRRVLLIGRQKTGENPQRSKGCPSAFGAAPPHLPRSQSLACADVAPPRCPSLTPPPPFHLGFRPPYAEKRYSRFA